MASIPIVVSIDLEPDRRVLARDSSEPVTGFEKLVTLLPGLRDRIAGVTGTAPSAAHDCSACCWA